MADIQKDTNIHLTQEFQEWDKATFLEGLAWQLRDLALPDAQYSAGFVVKEMPRHTESFPKVQPSRWLLQSFPRFN